MTHISRRNNSPSWSGYLTAKSSRSGNAASTLLTTTRSNCWRRRSSAPSPISSLTLRERLTNQSQMTSLRSSSRWKLLKKTTQESSLLSENCSMRFCDFFGPLQASLKKAPRASRSRQRQRHIPQAQPAHRASRPGAGDRPHLEWRPFGARADGRRSLSHRKLLPVSPPEVALARETIVCQS